jgi:hypothetical protein
MKKILILITISICIQSCVKDDINTDPNSAYTTVPETLISNAQKELSDYMNTPNVNENNFRLTMQYWQEVTYTNESIYDFANRTVSDNAWIDNYVSVLNNLIQAKKLVNAYIPTSSQASTWSAKKQNELAIIDVMMIYVFQTMVDTHGNVPYSQALNVDEFPLPKYDDASTIYQNLITRLNDDISKIDVSVIFSSSENFYKGDYYYKSNATKWRKFANSLLLKLGIAISDSNATLAQNTVNQAIAGGVITSAADNCQLQYLAASPNFNPLFENLSASGRNDYFACKTLVDYMNSKNDTRISKYYEPKGGSGSLYIGQVTGLGGLYADFSHIGSFAYTATTPGTILNNTEVAFYLAEAAARWTPVTAATAYDNAVTASFLQWGLTNVDATTYLTTNPYVAVNWKKSIGEQAWVAMYNQANTAWNFYRRLDFPVLTAPSNAIANAGGKVPVRMQYPTKESATNPSNWASASSAIGGDLLTTKIFWDKF